MWNPIRNKVIISREIIFYESKNKNDHVVTNNISENLIEEIKVQVENQDCEVSEIEENENDEEQQDQKKGGKQT